LTEPQKKIFVLDSSVFIRLDFPIIQSISEATFFSPYSVKEELKDFRSKTNLELLIQTEKIKMQSPDLRIVNKVKTELKVIDPGHKLSQTDIEVISLAWEKKGTVLSNDLAVQNAAVHLKIPIQIISGKKIDRVMSGYLKCKGCSSVFYSDFPQCPNCGSALKLLYLCKRINENETKG
jgi:UPF0271 protein